MNTLVSIIIIVFGILQIILFFKVWGMTNDVKKIKDKQYSIDKTNMAQIEYMKGNTSKAKELLDDDLFDSILNVRKSTNYYPEFIKNIDSISEVYDKLYRAMGLEMPNIEKYKEKGSLPL